MTGGASGLGAGIVSMLLKNGAKVMVFDVNTAAVETSPTLSKCTVDVSDEASVVAGFQATVKEFGRVDIMVNCAGIVGPHGMPTAEVDTAGFDQVYAGEGEVCGNRQLKQGLLYSVHHFKLVKCLCVQ